MRQALDLYYDGLDCLAEGEPARAIRLFREALARDASLADARHGLVRAFGDAGRFEEGLAEAHALVEHAPEDPLAFTALSILLQRMGRVPEAEAAATRAKLLGWKQQLREGREAEAEPQGE